MKALKWFGIVLAVLLVLGLLVPLGVRFFGWYWGWAFNPDKNTAECEVCTETPQDVESDSIPLVDEVCIADFVDAGASYSFAKTICSDNDDDGYAWRLDAGQHCNGWGTIVYDNDSDVEIVFNFDAPIVASYSYCYPDGSDIRNAPFFVGAELNPFGNPFDIIFVEN